MKKQIIIFSALVLLFTACGPAPVELLKDGNQTAQITLISKSDAALGLAIKDLQQDMMKISGRDNQATLSSRIIIAKIGDIDFGADPDFQGLEYLRDELEGKWESCRVFDHEGDLYIIGSDLRGTLWGIYGFIEEYLGIDPMYLWTDREPEQTDELILTEVNLSYDEPTFKYRGWFVNDEDFLTEWKQFEGRRNNDYKYYSRIMHPDASDMIIETALRLRMNLIIPSSFNDILNPPEAYPLQRSADRGLIVSQHHIEPLGVGGFNFDDYFEKQGKEAPLFSYMKHPDLMKEVWTEYVRAWSAFPDVIWQLGLRGRGDRPMWIHDPDIPRDEESRGKLISEAINFQHGLVRQHDPDGVMTITLWMEMSKLMAKGLINIPEDITIVFADNSPGWGWSPDFYAVDRQDDLHYGVYYHHQLWGTGPHFIQGIPPGKTHEVIKEAADRQAGTYCVLNVGNVREFVLGLKLSADLLFDLESYDPEAAMADWMGYYYGKHQHVAGQIYEQFFKHYMLDTADQYLTGHTEMPDSPYLLDGHLATRMKSMLVSLNEHYGLPEFRGEAWVLAAEFAQPRAISWSIQQGKILESLQRQKERIQPVIREADRLYKQMDGHPAYFFDVNLRTPAKMFEGLMECTAETMMALREESLQNRSAAVAHLERALAAMEKVNRIKSPMLQGKWKHWYRGEYKIRFTSYEAYLEYLLKGIQASDQDIR